MRTFTKLCSAFSLCLLLACNGKPSPSTGTATRDRVVTAAPRVLRLTSKPARTMSARSVASAKVIKPVPSAPTLAPTRVTTPVRGVEIKRVVFAKAVAAREPVGPGTTFSHAQTPKVWVFLELENQTRAALTLDVRWELVGGTPNPRSVQLSVPKATRWRTQAFMSTDKKPGTYRCVIRDEGGAVLVSQEVEITA